jgi:hypothetical protein
MKNTLRALSVFSLLTASPAGAQDAPPVEADVAVEATVTTEAAPEPEPDPALDEAMERYGDAHALFERGDFRGALAELERVHELLAGRDNQYIVLYDLGRVYEELHRYDLAVAAYQRYLDESPPDAEDRNDVGIALGALERLLGTIAIEVDVEDVEVWIGEWQVGVAPGEIRVPSGVHVLELRSAGHETVRRQIEVTARSRIEIVETMPVLNDFRGLDPALFIASTTLAVVAAGVGFALGGVAMSLNQDATACRMRVDCSLPDPDGRRREISDFALGADVLFGTAGLFAVTSIVLVFVTDWGGRPADDAASSAGAFRLVPHAGPEGGGATVTIAF